MDRALALYRQHGLLAADGAGAAATASAIQAVRARAPVSPTSARCQFVLGDCHRAAFAMRRSACLAIYYGDAALQLMEHARPDGRALASSALILAAATLWSASQAGSAPPAAATLP